MNLNNYDYFLPEKNLALKPAVPRDSSKLFIYNTKTDKIVFDRFYNLDQYLPENSFLVMNDTKVLPARVTMKKEKGGKVILLFLVNELTSSRVIKVLADRKISIGDRLFFDPSTSLRVKSQKENIFSLKFDFTRGQLFNLLKQYGTMPIPPYLKRSPLSRDELIKKYQTVFAKTEGSAAAPTASLHFTDRVFKRLDKKGIKRFFITLHVGLGTFAPITNANIEEKKLHEEYYEINKNIYQSINKLKQEEKKLVAVGTTVTRTLESAAVLPPPHLIFNKTDLFIFPPYNFKLTDVIITNFHLPKSSLMMLVEAFLQHKKAKKALIELYNMAIKNDFRFYSFGDVMLII